MKALFDADILVFRAGLGAERNHWYLQVGDDVYEFDYKKDAKAKLDELLPGVYSRQEGEDYRMWAEVKLEPLSHALHNVKTMVASALDAIQCNDFDVEMFMSPSNGRTFRHELATTRPYKGNRDRSHRPTYEKEIRDFIKSTWPTVEAENEEADDLLGIRATELGEDCVIISVDKDLDQIPGKKYNLMHGVAYDIDADEAEYRFAEQLLVGDQSDNVPGLPRIGKKKAQNALHSLKGDSDALWLEVVSQYMAHSPTEDWQEYMLEQGRLLYIRRQPGEMWQVPDVECSMEAFEATEVSLYADEATVGD